MTKMHWTTTQQNRLQELLDDPSVIISYWCSDQHGRPANGGVSIEQVYAGMIQEIAGPLQICTKNALHATSSPHIWRGNRVWIVALFGDIQKRDDKFCSLKREIIGDILPEECLDPSIGVRIGRIDLIGANLRGADLPGANLRGADLSGADLSVANLSRANLSGADLSRANLSGADLSGAYLYRVNLSGADLSGADLFGVDLLGADLKGTNF